MGTAMESWRDHLGGDWEECDVVKVEPVVEDVDVLIKFDGEEDNGVVVVDVVDGGGGGCGIESGC
jgi:hypothetical protein